MTLTRPAWRPLRDSRPRDVDAGLRRALEDPVEMGRHPLGVVAVVVTITAIVLIGGFFLRLPPLPGLRSTSLQHLSHKIFLLFLLLSKSFADFSFSADSRLLSRSTSSSFTGGFEDRASIDPCMSKDKS